MKLEEIIDNLYIESDRFECKGKLNRDDVVGWMKTIAGFANAYGGEFYIGVSDSTYLRKNILGNLVNEGYMHVSK